MNRKRVLRKLATGVGALVVVLVLVVWSRPDHFHVERSIAIDAKSDAVFSRVNDFHAWSSWSPYEKLDPTMARTYGGASSGVGARYAWKGNDKIGEGSMAIVESAGPSRIGIKLEFVKPFACTNDVTFTFEPQADGKTKVTWAMDTTNSFFSKAAALVFDMDALVGGDFERGLASLKAETEATAKAHAER